jgi:acetylornithine deacetylase/succinyl-diaminopimelate desuccinylase-like protein
MSCLVDDRFINELIAIQQIPAPTFEEQRRADHVYHRLCGVSALNSIHVDGLHNVYARLPGADPAQPALLISAHTDTVFNAGVPLDVQRQNGYLHGPGIGDNSLGVAALLTAAETLARVCATSPLPADIWFVANTREEGMGDLDGIKAVYERLGVRLGSAIVIEGMALGRIYHAGIAVRRLRITCKGPGGHSWLHFGRPSAIHSLVRLGAQIAAIQPPESPRTTYNMGVIEGGTTVNSIATDAMMLLDLRSESPETLAALEKTVRNLIMGNRVPDLKFEVEVVGDRPAGLIGRTHPLVQLATEVLESLHIRPVYENGSTDANVLLAAGLPAVTIGITQGGNAHRLDEYIELEGIADGLWQLVLLAYGVAGGGVNAATS